MAIELERRFFVRNLKDALSYAKSPARRIVQGYVAISETAVVRVRIEDNFFAFLTVKGKSKKVKGASDEFEYPIPLEDAKAMLKHRTSELVEKRRYLVNTDAGLTWEIDVFEKLNAGLVIAEIEIPTKSTKVALPSWLGTEIKPASELQRALRLSNAALSKCPVHNWSYADLEDYLPQSMAITIWKKSTPREC